MNFNDLRDWNNLLIIVVSLGITFGFCALGSFISESYRLFTSRVRSISPLRFIISTTCSAFVALFISDYFKGKLTLNMYFALCFVLGLLGFDICSRIIRLDFWIELYKSFRRKG